MTKESRIALLGFPIGFGLFFLLQRNVFSKKGSETSDRKKATATDQDMEDAGAAYWAALQDNQDAAVLNALNASFATEYNIQVHQSKADGTIVITDMAGNKIATYQPQT